ncbi:MAG: hypothetical protein OHK0015_56330 [Chloroflexi bacterium OHK40]
MRPTRSVLLALILLAITPFAVPAQAQNDQRCFPETGQCIAGLIRAYWERNGGLAVFGFPVTAQAAETVEGTPLQVQWFERDRLEIQPDGQVTAGRRGVERLEQLDTPWSVGQGVEAGPDCTAFPETGYQMCGTFAAYWRANGGLARFGFPVTGEFTAELEGRPYTVQYFERRRFELHPEIGPDAVLLGLLGREVLTVRQGQPQPVVPQPPAPQPPAPQPPAPQPPAPSYNNCQADPNAGAAPNFPVRMVAIDKGAETVTLRNVSGEGVSLNGWIMCSIRPPCGFAAHCRDEKVRYTPSERPCWRSRSMFPWCREPEY